MSLQHADVEGGKPAPGGEDVRARAARAVGMLVCRGHRTPPRRLPVMRARWPALLHRGCESLSHVLQLEIHSLPESV